MKYGIEYAIEYKAPDGVSTRKFQTLADAAVYIRENWGGLEGVDGPAEFRAANAEYNLVGFTLNDIGNFYRANDNTLEYRFND